MKRTKKECVFRLELERIDHGTEDEDEDDWFVLYNIIVTKTGKHIGWLKEEEPGIKMLLDGEKECSPGNLYCASSAIVDYIKSKG